jgi:hypothetical protein
MNNKNFNIELLLKNDILRKKKKKEIYKILLQKCINHILFSAKNNRKECDYIIPLFLYGKPLYDINECSKYIQKKINKLNIKISGESNKLFISWNHIK